MSTALVLNNDGVWKCPRKWRCLAQSLAVVVEKDDAKVTKSGTYFLSKRSDIGVISELNLSSCFEFANNKLIDELIESSCRESLDQNEKLKKLGMHGTRSSLTKRDILLYSFRALIPPNQLFARLIAKYDSMDGEASESSFQLRILNMIADWLKLLEKCEIESFKGTMTDFISQVEKKNSSFTSLSESLEELEKETQLQIQIKAEIQEKIDQLEEKRKEILELGQDIPTYVQTMLNKVRTVPTRKHLLLDMTPTSIAMQLTHKDFGMLKKVRMHDMLHHCLGNDGDLVLIESLEAYYEWLDMVPQWVASEIGFQSNLKRRAATVNLFIQVAQECQKLNNLNGFAMVIRGLSFKSVKALRKSVEAADDYKEFKEIIASIQQDYEGNFQPKTIGYIPDMISLRNKLLRGVSYNTFNEDKTLNQMKIQKIALAMKMVHSVQTHFPGCEKGPEEVVAYLDHMPILSDLILTHYSNIIEPSKSDSMFSRYREALRLIDVETKNGIGKPKKKEKTDDVLSLDETDSATDGE